MWSNFQKSHFLLSIHSLMNLCRNERVAIWSRTSCSTNLITNSRSFLGAVPADAGKFFKYSSEQESKFYILAEFSLLHVVCNNSNYSKIKNHRDDAVCHHSHDYEISGKLINQGQSPLKLAKILKFKIEVHRFIIDFQITLNSQIQTFRFFQNLYLFIT